MGSKFNLQKGSRARTRTHNDHSLIVSTFRNTTVEKNCSKVPFGFSEYPPPKKKKKGMLEPSALGSTDGNSSNMRLLTASEHKTAFGN